MYHNTPSIDLATLIAAAIGVIMIITFFIMARRLRRIKDSTDSMNKLFRFKAEQEGILIEVTCHSCSFVNDIIGDHRPVFCKNCGANIEKDIPIKP